MKVQDINNIRGLSEAEVRNRLKRDGYNEIPSAVKRNIFAIAFDIVKEPMFLLLIASGIIYLLLGNTKDALILLGFVFVVLGITFYQERKTERTLEALRDLSSPRALVIREGKQKRIAGREVVRGDIIVLKEGDRVPADALVISCVNLLVDESLLTGESVPVRKSAGELETKPVSPGGDDLPFVYSGTLVVQGTGIAQVGAIGINSELGKIGKSLKMLEPEDSPLQKQIARLVRNLLFVGLTLCIAVVILYGFTRGVWLDAFLAGITLAMAILPEEFPVVLTIFLALGAWRMSRQNVLTRKSRTIQTLGSATVLCVDKTGTLTLNQMSVKRIFSSDRFFDIDLDKENPLPENFHELVEYGILASQKDPFDPMEKAIRSLGIYKLADTEHLHDNWLHIREYPLSKELLALSNVWKSPDGDDYLIAAKGAPEAIADLCHLSESEISKLNHNIDAMAKDGLRVIGVAHALFRKPRLPAQQHEFNFRFLGLIGFEDPIRPGVTESVRQCYEAGIKVIMITGDYASTAYNIAKQIGLKNPDKIITGAELNAMNDEQLKQKIPTTTIFARVVPEQKLRIVQALKANHEIVVMTGDGVNDAPALKSAHIGIAMGGRGTDVAREASSLVLLDDDFSSIVRAIKMGRRISDNLKKAMSYILAVHIPIAGMSFLPVLFNWPLVLLPIHIAFLELVIDPVCSIVFEAEYEEEDVMKRPPKSVRKPFFGRRRMSISLIQGFIAMLSVVFVYIYYKGHNVAEARALAFTAIVVTNLGLILTNRSWTRPIWKTLFSSKNYALRYIFSITILGLGLILYVPFLNKLFRFDPPSLSFLIASFFAAVISIVWFEIYKVINNFRRTRRAFGTTFGDVRQSKD
jgi:Ca2+-transporting ATPase